MASTAVSRMNNFNFHGSNLQVTWVSTASCEFTIVFDVGSVMLIVVSDSVIFSHYSQPCDHVVIANCLSHIILCHW